MVWGKLKNQKEYCNIQITNTILVKSQFYKKIQTQFGQGRYAHTTQF